MPDTPAPIIIKKKVAGHGGHHGGAWKVAYADFVTAMMALFIVLWLMNSSKKVQEAVGGYFRDPSGKGKISGSGIAGNVPEPKDDMQALKEKIEATIRQLPEFQRIKDQVILTITAEGLRVELLETEKGMFFELGSAKPTPSGEHMLQQLAAELAKLPNRLQIEGHTDSRPYSRENGYSNWELSADRANAARRLMMDAGVRKDQVAQIRGLADQRLLVPEDPESPSNRRVSVLVQYLESAKPPAQASPPNASKAH